VADTLLLRGGSRVGLKCRITPDVGNSDDVNTMRRMFDGGDKRCNHLTERDETEPPGRLLRGGNALEQPVDRPQHVWPAVSWTEHVPRSKDRRRKASVANQRFALGPRGNIGPHDWCGLGNADIHEVWNSRLDGRSNRFGYGYEIDLTELARLGWRWPRRSHQVHQRIGMRQTPGKRAPIENVADDDLAATGQSLLGSSADERPYAVTPAQQSRDQTATDVACATGHEHVVTGT
jgi:hypothetical protein